MMALRLCLDCSTAYAIGLQACPQCGSPTRNAIYDWEDDVVAKANAETGASLYVPEGGDTSDVPDGVRLVGPGAPDVPEAAPEAPEPEVVPDPPVSTPPENSPESSAPAEVAAPEVRAWAKDEGLEVADRGPLPAAVVEAFTAAQPDTPADDGDQA